MQPVTMNQTTPSGAVPLSGAVATLRAIDS